MEHRPRHEDKYKPDQYLKNVHDQFVFDDRNGVYVPKSSLPQKLGPQNPLSIGPMPPIRVEVARDRLLVALTIVSIAVSLVTLGVVAKYTYFAGGQWDEMKKATKATEVAACAAMSSAKTAEDALKTAQRAFVFPGETEVYPIPKDNQIESILFRFTWENSGTTPTSHMLTHASAGYYTQGLPKNFDFPDVWDEGAPHISTPAAVGPHGKTGVSAKIPSGFIRALQLNQTRIYFWGWTRYHDIFEGTPEHVTLFCYELKRFIGDPLDPKSSVGHVELDNCEVHNCYDQDCKGQTHQNPNGPSASN